MGSRLKTVAETQAEALTQSSSSQLLRRFQETGAVDEEALGQLLAIVADDDSAVARVGLCGLFAGFAEQLADSFDPSCALLYDLTFVRVIDWCRRQPRGQRVDNVLRDLGIDGPEALLRRRDAGAADRYEPQRRETIQCCVVPSRVTLGADVAVTSVVVFHLLQRFPRSMVVILGEPRLRELFYEEPRVEIVACTYPAIGLFERLEAWCDAAALVERTLQSLPAHMSLILDPDSRLTQLGLLPLAPESRRALHFDSRSYRAPGAHYLATLAGRWLLARLGGTLPRPRLTLPPASTRFARLVARLLCRERRPIVSLTFGTGDNEAKRLGFDYEVTLVRQLLRRGVSVVLFRGVGEMERERTARLLLALQAATSARILELRGNDPSAIPGDDAVDLVAWEGSIGTYCALIGASNLHVGYDSSGQHVAAALGVPTVDLFVEAGKAALEARWTPAPRETVRVVRAYRCGRCSEVVEQVLLHTNELLALTP